MLSGDTAEQRRARRGERTRPVLDELRAWIDDRRAVVPPKTFHDQTLWPQYRALSEDFGARTWMVVLRRPASRNGLSP